jgi:hypothetical protein
MAEVADAGEDEFLVEVQQFQSILKDDLGGESNVPCQLLLTSAFSTSSGDLTHSTVYPTFSMALTRLRTFPAT